MTLIMHAEPHPHHRPKPVQQAATSLVQDLRGMPPRLAGWIPTPPPPVPPPGSSFACQRCDATPSCRPLFAMRPCTCPPFACHLSVRAGIMCCTVEMWSLCESDVCVRSVSERSKLREVCHEMVYIMQNATRSRDGCCKLAGEANEAAPGSAACSMRDAHVSYSFCGELSTY